MILGIAAPEGSPARGVFLLLAFSLGFGLWFVLAALGFRKAMGAFGAIRRHMGALIATGGILMVAIGVLMVAGLWDDLLAPLRRMINDFAPPL